MCVDLLARQFGKLLVYTVILHVSSSPFHGLINEFGDDARQDKAQKLATTLNENQLLFFKNIIALFLEKRCAIQEIDLINKRGAKLSVAEAHSTMALLIKEKWLNKNEGSEYFLYERILLGFLP